MTSPLQQKLRVTGPVVVTANLLADGAVVYRTAGGEWSNDLADAVVATEAKAAAALLAASSEDSLQVIGAYVAPVAPMPDGGVHPGNLRETIRQRGPTIDVPPPRI